MLLKSVVITILKEKKRPMKWLAAEMGRTSDGLKLSLMKGSLKYNDLLKLADILEVPATTFFPKDPEGRAAKNTTFLGVSATDNSSSKKELSNCQEMVKSLRDQLKDKEKIISLLSKP